MAGATWVAGGFRDSKRAEDNGEAPSSSAKAEKIFGYSVIGLYSVSAIYGYCVLAKCQAIEQQRAKAAASAAAQAVRYPFPQRVLGFGFGQRLAEAQQACATAHGAWDASNEQPLCRASAPSSTQPDVRLELNLGTVQRITLIYPASSTTLDQVLRDVQQSALRYYGPQQAPGSWYWSAGNIHLESVNRDERPAIELTFERAQQ